jgi:ribosomal protein S18 acetylase RimI-like enzyme
MFQIDCTAAAGGREFLLTASRNETPLGRARVTAEPLSSQIPELEYRVSGVELPWDGEWPAVGDGLLEAAARLVPPGHVLDARLNAEVHDRLAERRRLLEAGGFSLFQEKEGFAWADDGRPIADSGRLVYRSLAEMGREAFSQILARGPEATLDRNDRYYWGRSGPAGWAAEMLGFCQPDDEASWLAAFDRSGDPVGYVLVSAFDEEGVATIAHIGVLPESRGQGYVMELVHESMREARRRGFRAMLSDADTENWPMLAAFERAGHSATARAWHVWHYRRTIGD